MKKNIALLALYTSVLVTCVPVHASQWVELDRLGSDHYLLRQGDRKSLQRTGPWAEFTQQWVGHKTGGLQKWPASTEIMALNCLTGARFAKSYEVSDPDTDAPVLRTHSFSDIEQGSSPNSRLDIAIPRQGLDANLINFACACQNPQVSKASDENTLLRIYDTFIKEQTKEVGYRLHIMRFPSKEKANLVLKRLSGKASHASVAGQLKPHPAFQGEDLGVHPAFDWAPHKVALFHTMKPGEYTQPINGANGYEIYFMGSRYEKPAEPFNVWRTAIQTYANREQSCGREP